MSSSIKGRLPLKVVLYPRAAPAPKWIKQYELGRLDNKLTGTDRRRGRRTDRTTYWVRLLWLKREENQPDFNATACFNNPRPLHMFPLIFSQVLQNWQYAVVLRGPKRMLCSLSSRLHLMAQIYFRQKSTACMSKVDDIRRWPQKGRISSKSKLKMTLIMLQKALTWHS